MSEPTYNVITTGKLLSGFEAEQVEGAFAKLFKVDEQRAKSIIHRKGILKKSLDETKAQKYKLNLEGIGVQVLLEASEPKVEKPKFELALEPIAEPPKPESGPESEDQGRSPSLSKIPSPNHMVCPKCEFEQAKSEQCVRCGVFVEKALKAAEPTQAVDDIPKLGFSKKHVQQEEAAPLFTGLTLQAVAVGGFVAFLGALLWRFVALTFDLEIGYVAWAIGGGIGFSVALTGARGQNTALACGVLAMVAIFGGKYMTMAGFKDQLVDVIGENKEAMAYAYEEEKRLASLYMEVVTTLEEQKDFMVEYGYTEAYEIEEVSDEELRDFDDYTVPRFRQLSGGDMNLDEWYKSTGDIMQDVSTWDMVKESLGFLDLVFLLLGVGTAYQLGKGRE